MSCVDLWLKDKSWRWWREDEGVDKSSRVKVQTREREPWSWTWRQSQNGQKKSYRVRTLPANLHFFSYESFMSYLTFFLLTFFLLWKTEPLWLDQIGQLTCQVRINISLVKYPFIKMGCFFIYKKKRWDVSNPLLVKVKLKWENCYKQRKKKK